MISGKRCLGNKTPQLGKIFYAWKPYHYWQLRKAHGIKALWNRLNL